jgi:Ni2+-binding GTPase involved in maturation of urease and hydrogenase
VPFQVDRAVGFALQVNPALQILSTSALEPEGLKEWYSFLWNQARRKVTR